MALSVALLRPGLIGGCAVLNARVLPETVAKLPDRPDLDGMPVFVGHGTADAVVRPDRGRIARDVLSSMGARLTYHEYRAGHEVTLEMVADVADWLQLTLARMPTARDGVGPHGAGRAVEERDSFVSRVRVSVRGAAYELGEHEAGYREAHRFEEKIVQYEMLDNAAAWGWGRFFRSGRSRAELAVASARRTLALAGCTGAAMDAVILCAAEFPASVDCHAHCRVVVEGLGLDARS